MILGYLALCWLLGMAAAAFAHGNPWAIAAAALLAAILPLATPRSAFALLWAAVAAALLVGGAWLYQSSLPSAELQGIATYNVDADARSNVEPITFRAVVSGEPDERGSSLRLRLSAREVLVDGRWQTTSGGVLMRAGLFPRYDYGDLLELKGIVPIGIQASDGTADTRPHDHMDRDIIHLEYLENADMGDPSGRTGT